MNKKGQIQLMESTVVMFIFFFMLVMGMVMYNNFQSSKLEVMERQFEEQKAIQIAQKITNVQELQCSDNNVITLDCFELQKLQSFKDKVKQHRLYYKEAFGSSKVSVVWVYAPAFSGNFYTPKFFQKEEDDNKRVVTEDEEEQVLFDFSSGKENKDTFYYPISLWDKRFVPQKSYFGWLIIEAYSND